MIQWEHRRLAFYVGNDRDDQLLNEFVRDGWELVACFPNCSAQDVEVMYFKRQIEEKRQ